MAGSVALLLGKAPRPGTIVADVLVRLKGAGVACRVRLPHDEDVLVGEVSGADLVLHRGLSPGASRVLPLLDAAGTDLCNPWSGTAALQDRATLHAALERAGLPTPRATTVTGWERVRELGAAQEVVVKAVAGAGRGRGVLAGPLPQEPPMPGPYLVESRIPHDGVDRKLYVTGGHVHGLLKPSTLVHEHTTRGATFDVPDDLTELALATARAVGLHLLGVDVVLGPEGPVVVDVNAFPGYRDVPGAADEVAEHLLGHLHRAPTIAG